MTLTPQELRALFIAVFDEFHDGPFLDKESSVKRLTHTFNFELHGHCEGAAAVAAVRAGIPPSDPNPAEGSFTLPAAFVTTAEVQLAKIQEAAHEVRSLTEPTNQQLDKLAEKFLTWPLLDTVQADLCVTVRFHPNRTGTNLLSFNEAKAMFRYVLADHITWITQLIGFWKVEEADWRALNAELESKLRSAQAAARADHAANLAYNEQVTKLQVVNTDLTAKLREWETGSCSREVAAGVVEELTGYLHHEPDCESLAPSAISGSCSCGLDEIIKKHHH